MTVAPSTSLHVETPKLADIKPSATYPPTPVTPYSHNSATSSRLDLPPPPLPEGRDLIKPAEDEEQPTTSDTSAKIDRKDSATDIMSPEGGLRVAVDQARHADLQKGEKEKGNEVLAGRVGMPGIVCAPPEILPPSPPLTVADSREELEVGSSTLSGVAGSSAQHRSSRVPPPSMREEDITSWRASMHEGVGESAGRRRDDGEGTGAEEEEGEEEVNGEYDPYDLGYSPETPVGPSHARMPTTPTGASSQQKRDIVDHPLRLDIHPPSPPPWEVFQPPDSIENVLAETRMVYPSSSTNNGRKPL